MITKTNAVKISIMKWKNKAADKTCEFMECGFCTFFGHDDFHYPNKKCQNCPLFPDVCKNRDENHDSLYHKYSTECNRKRRIELAKEMLATIKERGAKWIKGD